MPRSHRRAAPPGLPWPRRGPPWHHRRALACRPAYHSPAEQPPPRGPQRGQAGAAQIIVRANPLI